MKESDISLSTIIDEYVKWLRDEVTSLPYGEIGLKFTIHDGNIAKAHSFREVVRKPILATNHHGQKEGARLQPGAKI